MGKKLENTLTGLEVAIVGMAGRFAGSSNINEFWENIKNGISTATNFTDEELQEAGISKELLENPSYVKVKGLMKDIEHFDSKLLNIDETEAAAMDPQIRVMLECAYEAMEDAGCGTVKSKERIGIYAGAMPNYQWEMNMLCQGENAFKRADSIYLIDKDTMSSFIAYKLGLRGPCASIMTECSAALSAIHMASRALLMGECRAALAGGVCLHMSSVSGYEYKEGGLLSKDGKCRSYDAKGTGTFLGDGAGMVVLKLMEDAIEDGDKIYAIIKGSAVYNDGCRKASYITASADGIAETVKLAGEFGGVELDSISYIEGHGIGSLLGDALEIEGYKIGFNTDKRNLCAIGSLKPNIGHLGPASGVASFIKAVLCLNNKMIPPTINFEEPNPMIDFDNSPFYVNAKLVEWKTECLPRRAGVCSLGIGGTNAFVILEEMYK